MLRDMWKVGPHEWFDHMGTSLRRVTFEISGHFLGSATSTVYMASCFLQAVSGFGNLGLCNPVLIFYNDKGDASIRKNT